MASHVGFYRLRNDQGHLDSIAVNVDPAESDLRYLEASQLQAEFAASAAPAQRTVWHEGPHWQAQPLWPYCLLAAMLLASAESALILGCR
jgi:hypothetical protein